MSLPKLMIVIVNWNLKDYTLACLDSLFAAGAKPGQIILIDNGSKDNSIEAIQTHFGSTVKIISNVENMGLVHASNQGFNLAMEEDADWVLWMNNDTVVALDFFTQALPSLLQDKFAILSPIIFYYSRPDLVWYLVEYRIPGTLLSYNPYRNKPAPKNLPNLLQADFLSGCALFIRRNVFEQIGYLDPVLVMYGEELDFCWRASQAGYRLAAITTAIMRHKVSESAKQVKDKSRYYRIRNQIRFYRNYGRGMQRPVMFAYSLLRMFATGIGDMLHGQFILLMPLLKGWRDGWKL
jgi:GT2 family glycosyltransferase